MGANFENNKIAVLILLTALYFVFRMLANIFGDRGKTLVCTIIILSGLVEAVWGLLQLYGYLPSQHSLFKLTGSFFNPGPYSGYLAVVAPLTVFIILNGKHEGTKAQRHEDNNCLKLRVFAPLRLRVYYYLSAITFIAIMLVLPAAMSRAAWLAAISGCTVVVYKKYKTQLSQYYNKFKTQIHSKIHFLLLITFTLLITSTSLFTLYHLKKPSADGRLLTWKISLMTAAKHPMGVGLGKFSGAYGETQAAYFASGRASETEQYVAGNPEYGFNEYLQILVETGLVSLSLFLILVIQTIRFRWEKEAEMAGALIALLVFACFSYPFSVAPFLPLFVFLIGWKQTAPARFRVYHLIPVLLAAGMIYIQYPVYKAGREWEGKRIYYHTSLYREVVESYKPLYPFLNDRTAFLFEYGRSLSNIKQYEESNAVLQKAVQISCDPMLYNIMGKNHQALKDYSRAEACFIRAAQTVPARLYPWYLLMKLYDEAGLPEKASETAEIVLTKEPKVQSQAIREMREEARKLITKNTSFLIYSKNFYLLCNKL